MRKKKLFNIKKLIRQHITINGQVVKGYFLSYNKQHCFWQGSCGVWEFIETKDSKCPFIFVQLT